MSIEKVKSYFKQFNMEDKIMEFPVSSATVTEAAKALNCQEAHIAKTMSFKLNEDAILVVMAGDMRIDNHKFKEKFHKKATMLKADEVEPMTGFPIGGVCPFAPKDGVKVYTTEVIVEEQEFAESRAESDANRANFQHQAAPAPSADAGDGFMNIPEGIDDVLPFN